MLSLRLALPKLLAFGVLSVGALSLPPLQVVQRIDRALFDLWSRLAPPPADTDILVIEIPDAAGQAALIETARWQGARLLITTLDEAPVAHADDPPMLGPVALASARMPILRETGWTDGGYLWPRVDFDGVVRFERPVLGDVAETASLALAAARRLAAPDDDDLKGEQSEAAPSLQSDRGGRRWLRFFAPDSLRPISPESIRLHPDALTGKIVILGSTAGPQHRTPVGPLSTAELVAHALVGYRQGAAVTTSAWFDLIGWLIVAVWIAVLAATGAAGVTALVIPLAGGVSVVGTGALAFIETGSWLAVAGPGLLLAPLLGLALRRAPQSSATRSASSQPQTLLEGRRLIARREFVEAWEIFRNLPMSSELLGETYNLGCALAEHGEQKLAADAFHRVAQADAGYKDVTRRLVAATAVPRDSAPEPPKPTALGRYEVLGVIGSGAMGVVYLGRDPSINRIVAIKAIYLEQEFDAGDVQEARDRFGREAEIAGRLSHPSIVTIYDIGEEGGIAYIAMEYVRGMHLSDHTDPASLLPVPQVLDLTARAAEALDFAHRQNVVHRDIKPANIMYDSATDSLKITDFGVARLMDVSRTRTGVILGTPSYMSPEQLQGENVNGHTDLFALGVSLYELLTGHLPFRGTSMTELMFVISNEPHIPVTAIREELPSVLDSILERALAKDPADRYGDGAEMAAALRAAIDCC